MDDNNFSFFWQWRRLKGPEKDALRAIVNQSRGHISSVANGKKEAAQVLKMALALHLKTDVAILFPTTPSSKREYAVPSHMLNQHTLGDRA